MAQRPRTGATANRGLPPDVGDSRDQPHRAADPDAPQRSRRPGPSTTVRPSPSMVLRMPAADRPRPHRGANGNKHERRNGNGPDAQDRQHGEPRPIENVAFRAASGSSARHERGNRSTPRQDGGERSASRVLTGQAGAMTDLEPTGAIQTRSGGAESSPVGRAAFILWAGGAFAITRLIEPRRRASCIACHPKRCTSPWPT